jgi:ATP-dependent RNA helicase RhlE
MTGSGKTAVFVLPILQRLVGGRSGSIRALVVTPTRELATQVDQHFRDLGRHTNIRSTSIFGGVKPGPQLKALRGGTDVVVACPGRLLDHMRQPWLRFDELEVLILDEADRMLDMGFLPDIRRILARLPQKRQTMLFSATLPQPIVTLSRDLLIRPVRLGIEGRTAPATGVRQSVMSVPEEHKKDLLVDVLREEVKNALVFTRTKHRANRLAKYLDKAGIPCDRIHGNRSQPQRESALAAFKAGRIRVLVATDVASRGIDVEALSHVINFDVPNLPEDYVHRVGRTARAGATGEALTFVSPAEESELRAIERAVGRRIDRRSHDGSTRRAAGAEPRYASADSARATGPEQGHTASRTNVRRRRRGSHRNGGTEAQPPRSHRTSSKSKRAA